MNQGSDIDDAVVVQGDGVTVEKRFAADEFPVPAVSFTLRTERDDPAEFRLVDEIPEDFPMDRVGFHPEYESEHWTAYQDHRVEYRRRLEPGEEVTTVYGIRTDDPSRGEEFLGEPTIEEVAEDADPVGDVADVIGEDSSKVVRDVLSGERDAIPGDETDATTEADATAKADDSRLDLAAAEDDLGLGDSGEDESGDDVTAGRASADDDAIAEAVDESGVDPLAEPVEPPEDAADADAESGESDDGDREIDDPLADTDGEDAPLDEGPSARTDGTDVDTGADDDDADVGEPEPVATGAGAGGVAAALAAELRAGDVSEEDRELLKRELELDHSTSVDARVSRLQSKVEDLGAYTDALEEFIDENGTADELVEGVRADVIEVRDALDAVETDVADAEEAHEDLSEEVADVRGTVEDVTDDVTDRAEELEASVAEVRSELEELSDEVAEEDDAVAAVRDGMADVEDELESISAMLDDEVGELRAELAEVRAELEEFEEFRDRLSSVFGPGGAAAAGGDGANDADEDAE